jgi:1-acyl-sn-glycerol-3-phosphate acyltransferase
MVWARGVTLMENIVLGLDYKMLGMENFPPPPFIAAIQHQSAWETVKLLYWFKWPAVVMKAELGRIPFWGACSRRYGSIFVERSRKLEDLRHFVDSAKARVAQKRNVVLFPQGTRSLPEAPAKVQKGFVLLYEALNIPVVPMTLDSGKFWPRKSFIKYPGTITVTVHPPIMPGQPREEVLAKLEALYAYRP